MIVLVYIAALALLAAVAALIRDNHWRRLPLPAWARCNSAPALSEYYSRRGRNQVVDEEDLRILRDRMRALDERRGARVGDFVQFTDGAVRRISHIHGGSVQTSRGGSFYLGVAEVSFSGTLSRPIPRESLKRAGWTVGGPVWFFHHDHPQAGGAVTFTAKFRMFLCDTIAPQ